MGGWVVSCPRAVAAVEPFRAVPAAAVLGATAPVAAEPDAPVPGVPAGATATAVSEREVFALRRSETEAPATEVLAGVPAAVPRAAPVASAGRPAGAISDGGDVEVAAPDASGAGGEDGAEFSAGGGGFCVAIAGDAGGGADCDVTGDCALCCFR